MAASWGSYEKQGLLARLLNLEARVAKLEKEKAPTPVKESRPKISQYCTLPDGTVTDWYG